MSKLKCPEFVSLLNDYDVIGIQETKTDDLGVIDIPGYHVFLHNRSCNSRYRSGGKALMVKNTLLPVLSVDPEKSSKLIIFFTLSKIINGMESTQI